VGDDNAFAARRWFIDVHYEAFRFPVPKKDAHKLEQVLKVKEGEKK
jgi:hypothetical protein